jgi:hypothetical protein
MKQIAMIISLAFVFVYCIAIKILPSLSVIEPYLRLLRQKNI